MTRRALVWIVAAHGVAALPAIAAPGPETSSGGALDLRAPAHLLLGDSPAAGMEIDHDTLFTFGGFARVAPRLGRDALLVEGAWMHADKRAGAARGNVGGLFVSSGYAYEL